MGSPEYGLYRHPSRNQLNRPTCHELIKRTPWYVAASVHLPAIEWTDERLHYNDVDAIDKLLACVAPLGGKHIGLSSHYLWVKMDRSYKRFRRLRLYQNNQDTKRTLQTYLYRSSTRDPSLTATGNPRPIL